MADIRSLPYRPCVGIMLANSEGMIFVGQRIDSREGDAWQMPQGGVDPGEEPETSALRELGEEQALRRITSPSSPARRGPTATTRPPGWSASCGRGATGGRSSTGS